MTWKQNTLKVTKLSNSEKLPMSLSNFKIMLTLFFDIQDYVMAQWVPRVRLINHHYYIGILTRLRERVRRIRPGLWRNGWI